MVLRGSVMKIGYKIWLDSDGKAFGEGPYQLLRRVQKTGSLHQAALEMKMSYRKAWLLLRTMEERLGFPLLSRRVGGADGGGSEVTTKGEEFMNRYEAFHREVEETLSQIYAKYFG
jgi:molybdate transport system regulatory protein